MTARLTVPELGEAAYLAYCRRYYSNAVAPAPWSALGRRRRQSWQAAAVELRNLLEEEIVERTKRVVEVTHITKGATS